MGTAKTATTSPRAAFFTGNQASKNHYDNYRDRTLTEIWRALPKKVLWTTYTTILDYLEYSGKIHVEPDKTVTWLWDPEGIVKLKKNRLVVL